MFQPVLKCVPTSFNVVGPDPDFSISIPVTASDDGLRTVTLDVRLIPKSWAGVDVHELKFLFVVEDKESGEFEEIYGRDEAATYVAPVKHLIMDSVCAATEELIGHVQPQNIYRATFAKRPPEKALPKHQMITDTLQKLGYDEPWVGMDDYHRIRWVMRRVGDE